MAKKRKMKDPEFIDDSISEALVEPPKADAKLLLKIEKLETELATANNQVGELTKKVQKLEETNLSLHRKLASERDKLKSVQQLLSEKPPLPYPENKKIVPWVAKIQATCQ